MITLLLSVTADPAGGGYEVALFQEDGGGWPAVPLAACAIPAGLDPAKAPAEIGPGPAVERISQYVEANTQSDVFSRIGEYLAGLLLAGDVEACWDTIRRDHPDGVRTLLRIEPPELRLLPWELMDRGGDRLFVDPASPLARVQRLDEDDTQRLGPRLVPIRVLVVDGECDASLGTVDEVRAIKRALSRFGGRVEAEFLTVPSEKILRAAYERLAPHVFHFIGHGTRAPKTKEAALRVFDRSSGKAWPLTSEYVRNLLRPAPRLAVMNACRSGQVADVRSLTEAFLDGGAAAVIGMQGDVRGQSAAMFGGGVYQALADGMRIDEAVTRARRDVYAATGVARQGRDWFLPSLTLRVRPEHVLPMTSALSPGQWRQVESRLRSRDGFRVFVDRADQRYRLARWVDADADTDPRLLVLEGESLTGKSSLLHWIRRRCALHGHRVRYVNFREDRKLDLVGALCAIRDTDEDPPSRGRAAANAFDRFNYDLGYLADGRLPVEPPPGLVPHVEPPPVPGSLQPGPVALVDRMLESFRDALGATTVQSPLILILDHLDGLLQPAFQQELYPGLIRGIAEEDDLPGLRLIVALTTDQVGSYWPAHDRHLGEWIDVDLCKPDQWMPLAEDVVLALGKELREEYVPMFKLMVPILHVDVPWKLTRLKHVQQLAEAD
jgi:hypothetical protein